jgi:hypothetical protein
MKAIRIHERGGPEQLIYEDAPKPVPGRGPPFSTHRMPSTVRLREACSRTESIDSRRYGRRRHLCLARWKDGYVIGTASAANLAFVRELGAGEAIDYTAVRFEDVVARGELKFAG